jgi:hypothetical protein
MPVRYSQWNQPDYQESQQQLESEPRRIPSPTLALGPKGTRRSREIRNSVEAENSRETNSKSGQYECQHPNCMARFHQPQHLKTHIASHEGIKPFKCNFDGCDQTFTQKGNLKVSLTFWRE